MVCGDQVGDDWGAARDNDVMDRSRLGSVMSLDDGNSNRSLPATVGRIAMFRGDAIVDELI